MRLESELEEHRRSPPERNAKSLVVQNYKEREVYLNFEVFTSFFNKILHFSSLYSVG